MSVPIIRGAAERARRAEEQGWDGITFTDSQNLCPDPFVVFAASPSGTERIQLATGVTNVHTRHPAALATAAATVNEISEGRFVLGHRSRRHRAVPPRSPADAGRRLLRANDPSCRRTCPAARSTSTDVRAGSAGSTRANAGKVPLDIAASGPKVIEFSARTAERITFALGADPGSCRVGHRARPSRGGRRRSRPGRSDVRVVRQHRVSPRLDAARAMVHGSVAAFAHFSSMPGSTGAGLAEHGPRHRRRGRPQLRQQPTPAQRRHAHGGAHRRVHRSLRRHRHTRAGDRAAPTARRARHRPLRRHRPRLRRRPRRRPPRHRTSSSTKSSPPSPVTRQDEPTGRLRAVRSSHAPTHEVMSRRSDIGPFAHRVGEGCSGDGLFPAVEVGDLGGGAARAA